MNKGLDCPRIAHLMKIGFVAALMVLLGDMLLGWGIGNLWMFGGLLATMKKGEVNHAV